jgi:hypothetical protein
MPISQNSLEKISFQVIKVLFSRFENFPENSSSNRNAPFHAAFLHAFVDKFQDKVSELPFFISLSSWLHGLNTTLGETFFESVAHILSGGEKREYTSKKLGNLSLDRIQKENINSIITELSTGKSLPNLINENQKIFIDGSTETVSALNFSADVYLDDGTQITAIELKSVRPNSVEMRGEKTKILEGKAALSRLSPGKVVNFFIGFPFDPTNSSAEKTGYDKTRFLNSIINMNRFFARDEVLLAAEFWDFLSGVAGTMEELLRIINAIATPEFITKYEFVSNQQNKFKDLQLYKTTLREWNLFSELELVNNEEVIKEKIALNKKLIKIYNQLPFTNGKYNKDRYNTLKSLL